MPKRRHAIAIYMPASAQTLEVQCTQQGSFMSAQHKLHHNIRLKKVKGPILGSSKSKTAIERVDKSSSTFSVSTLFSQIIWRSLVSMHLAHSQDTVTPSRMSGKKGDRLQYSLNPSLVTYAAHRRETSWALNKSGREWS